MFASASGAAGAIRRTAMLSWLSSILMSVHRRYASRMGFDGIFPGCAELFWHPLRTSFNVKNIAATIRWIAIAVCGRGKGRRRPTEARHQHALNRVPSTEAEWLPAPYERNTEADRCVANPAHAADRRDQVRNRRKSRS